MDYPDSFVEISKVDLEGYSIIKIENCSPEIIKGKVMFYIIADDVEYYVFPEDVEKYLHGQDLGEHSNFSCYLKWGVFRPTGEQDKLELVRFVKFPIAQVLGTTKFVKEEEGNESEGFSAHDFIDAIGGVDNL